MIDKNIELTIKSPETKLAIERAAAARGMSVSELLEGAVAKFLADTGDIDEKAAH
jgi:hypothetical protein